MASEKKSLPIGTILDSGKVKYRITDVLGDGGFGITYLVSGYIKVENVTTEGTFAIKEHFPSKYCGRKGLEVVAPEAEQEKYVRSKSDFISEAKKLHALGSDNENIVKVNEVFEANGTAYYVMQYIKGKSLAEYVKSKGPLPYQEAVALLAPIFDAVGFLHKSRINHLDIKPDNIMLHDDIEGLKPILIDFGLSVHFKKNGDKTSPKGVEGVSAGYSPLEQYAGIDQFNPATDIYSLATTLLFALTGVTPRKASELRLADVRKSLEGKVPDTYIEGICKALNKSYEDRTDSVALLKANLGIEGESTGSVTQELERVRKESRHKNIWIWAICGAAIVAAGLIFWLGGSVEKSEENTLASESLPVSLPDSVAVESPLENLQTEEEAAKLNEEQKNEESDQQEAPKKEENIGRPADKPIVQNQNIPPTSAKVEEKPKPTQPASGTLSLGYGTWTGGIKNGKPDGHGKIVYTASHKVHPSSSAMASPGDYFIANYESGSLVSGKLYDAEGNLIKTIIP